METSKFWRIRLLLEGTLSMSQYLQYIARIFVPTSGENGKNGTCYPIAPNRVITAAHVLEGWDQERPIQIWWNQHSETKPLEWQDAEVVWNGREEEIDAAILKTRFPEQIDGYARLSLIPPKFKEAYESRGFPVVGKTDDDREAVPITGEVIQYVQIDKYVALGIDFSLKKPRPKKEAAGWKGASGAPVIVGDRFLGVLANCPVAFGAGRVNAVPFCILAQNHAFFDAIEYTEDLNQLQRIREERRQAVQSELQSRFCPRDDENCRQAPKCPQEDLVMALLTEMAQRDARVPAVDPKDDCGTRAETLASLLVEADPKAILKSLLVVTQTKGEAFRKQHFQTIRRLVELVLPVTFDRVDSAIRSAKRDGNAYALQAASQTMAELAIASLENREARFSSPDEASRELPVGERSLPASLLEVPELGQNAGVDDRADAVVRHIAAKSTVGGKEIFPQSATKRGFPTLLKLLRICLQDLRKDGGSLYFALEDNGDKRTELHDTAIALKQRVKEIAVVSLRGGDEDYLREYESLRSLRDLLQEIAKATK